MNRKCLRKQFVFTREIVHHIVKRYDLLPQYLCVAPLGVNPWGLLPNYLCQMDVTHIEEFVKLSYVLVAVKTYAQFLMATMKSGESAKQGLLIA